MEATFALKAFEEADATKQAALAEELASEIGERLKRAPVFHQACYDVIEELRRTGHDIWSFDESDDFQDWGPNYAKDNRRGLYISFNADGFVEVEWKNE